MEEIALKIEGMSCGHCKKAVEQLLNETDGVKNVSVDLAEGLANLEFDASKVSIEELKEKVNESGMYQAS